MKNQVKILIFDADDTLWENNIYYVKATSAFVDLACSIGFSADDVQTDFDALEIQVVKERGYGSQNFVYILEQLFEKYKSLNGRSIERRHFQKIIDRFSSHPKTKPALFPGVIETLKLLKNKYEIFVLTKGEFEEQQGKLIRSGIADIVDDYFIPEEKNDAFYRKLIREKNWNPEQTCMVGNSPKSDINPALRNGMYAVYIPYTDTWKLDFEPIESKNGRFFELSDFTALRALFGIT